MPTPADSIAPELDTCGCAPSADAPTPVSVENAPGLPALAWRVGTHGRFLAAQKLRLAAHPALRALSTREPSDPAIALLDAWSCVLDVLTFHQERFAQENYLRTATERRSVLELARAIGYELRPGVAASVALAFTVESVPGAPASVRLDPGLKVQSVPGQDEKPQTFETIETLEARPGWNALRPRLSESSLPLTLGETEVWLEGTSTGLQPGDALLFLGDERKAFAGSERWDFRRVAALELFPLSPLAGPGAGRTRVTLDRPLGHTHPTIHPSVAGTEVYALRQRANVFGSNATDWKALPDLTKRAYLGLADGTTLTADQKAEWKNFTVFSRGSSAALVEEQTMSAMMRASSPEAADPTAEDVQRVASSAAERVAKRYEALAKDSAIRSTQGAIASLSGLAQAGTALLGALGQNAAARSAALGEAALGLVTALRSLMAVNAPLEPPSFDENAIRSGAGEFTFNPNSLFKPGDSLVELKKIFVELARYLRHPLLELKLDPANLQKVQVALTSLVAASSPLHGAEELLGSTEFTGALNQAQSAAAKALEDSGKVTRATAAAIAAREASSFVAAATRAALDGLIPYHSDTRLRDHVATVAHDVSGHAVDVVRYQDDAAAANLTLAYPLLAPAAAGLLALNQFSEPEQIAAATAVRDAVRAAVGELLAPADPDSAPAEAARSIASAMVAAPEDESSAAYVLDLDQPYPKTIAAGGWLVLSSPDYQELYPIASAVEAARAEFGLSAKTTRITLGAGEHHARFDSALREVVVYAQSERLAFASRPLTTLVEGNDLVLDTAVADLPTGRLLALTGTDAATGLAAAEIVELRAATLTADGLTSLALSAPLARSYVRDSLLLNANVARATHGDTKRAEILGSGDGSRPFQSFPLKQSPLTHVSSPLAPGGAAPALEIRVGGVLWREVPSFLDVGPAERVYTLRLADDGITTVRFGDGRTGARLPTGVNNVVATYRAGLGLEGQVAAGSLTTLLTRPLGAKAVSNPLAAAGAADPEQLADARDNAPLTVLTLDRVVSVRDHEDFARAYAGIGKARADLVWDGERRLIHLTVAAADGTALDPLGETYRNLRAALDGARHAARPVQLAPHVPLSFGLEARIATDPDLLRDEVLAAVHAALASAFGFATRSFGQGVAASQIMTVIQNVPGVVAVDLDTVGYIAADGTLSAQDALTAPNLPARLAHRDAQQVLRGAELLLVSLDHVTLSELSTTG